MAFVGEDEFHLHLWQVLGREQVRVQVRWGDPVAADGNRKALARQSREAVQALLAEGVALLEQVREDNRQMRAAYYAARRT
jgi:hypothetical protein